MTLQNPINVINEHEYLWDVSVPMPYSSLLLDIIEKALKRNAKERYQTAKEMLLDLDSMKVRDKRYKQLNRVQTAYNIATIALLITGVWFIIRSSGLIKAEGFDKEYAQIVSEANSDDYDKTILDSIDLLNDPQYASIMDDRQQEKADLLFMIANSYFEKDDYTNAIPFYEETVSTDSSNPEYYRDYAIANARTGNMDEAQRILDDGIGKGLVGADLYLVNAEIESAKGGCDKAVQDFERVVYTTDNEVTRGRAYYLWARAYKAQGELERAKEILEDSYNKVNDVWRRRVLREEGSICLQYLEEHGKDETWMADVEKCYRALTNTPQGTFNDWMNYSLVLHMKGQSDKAIEALDQIRGKYPDDYRLPLRQALFEIEVQAGFEEDKRDYRDVEKFYKEADALYKKYQNSGDSNDEMQYLETLMQDLYDKGWL